MCGRYTLGPFSGARFFGDDILFVHWDDDEGTTRSVWLDVWIVDVDDDGNRALVDRVEAISVSAGKPQPPAEYTLCLWPSATS